MMAMPMTVMVTVMAVMAVTVMAMVGRGGARRSNAERQCGGDCQC
jgi:hypothetical protein